MTRRFPWAEVLGWTALVLAAVGAGGVALAATYAIQASRNPQSFGDLAAAVVLIGSAVPSVLALPVGIVHTRSRSGPLWRSRTTVVLAALAPVALVVVAITNAVA